MHLEYISSESDMAAIGPQWQALASKCAAATVFQTFEWNSIWWQHYGRTPGRRLCIMAWRDREGGPLVGLAPLMTGWWHGTPLRRMTFMGAGASDYHDLLALPGRENDAAEAFYAAIRRRVADLPQLREGGLLQTRPPRPPKVSNWVDSPQEACPFLPLPESWDALLKTFGKKTRSNIGYYERGLRKVFQVEMSYVSEPETLDEEMDRLFELHQRRWNQRWLPGVFYGRRVQSFHRSVARSLLALGALRLFTLKLDGETQAALYCFAFGDRLCYYQGGFEPTLAKWSLGTVLTAFAIQTAISEGRSAFDFLRGDEPYKSKWTSQSHTNQRRLITPSRSLLAPIAQSLYRAELDIEQRVKSRMRGKR